MVGFFKPFILNAIIGRIGFILVFLVYLISHVSYVHLPTLLPAFIYLFTNWYVCTLEKSHTIQFIIKILYRVTRETANFQWGQEQRTAFLAASKLISMHTSLINIEPNDSLVMDAVFIGELATRDSS